jgi:hypothetical protein
MTTEEILYQILIHVPEASFHRVGSVVLEAARTLEEEGRVEEADAVAETLRRAMRQVLVRAGKIAVLAPDVPSNAASAMGGADP